MKMKVDPPKKTGDGELKLPQALEQALAFKNERAKQVCYIIHIVLLTIYINKYLIIFLFTSSHMFYLAEE